MNRKIYFSVALIRFEHINIIFAIAEHQDIVDLNYKDAMIHIQKYVHLLTSC